MTAFVVLSALLGVCVHFLTSLPDLVTDNKSGARNLPLRIALRTGAPRLLVVSLVVTVLVVGADHLHRPHGRDRCLSDRLGRNRSRGTASPC